MEKAKTKDSEPFSSLSPGLEWEEHHSYPGRRYFLDKERAESFSNRVGGKLESFYLMINADDPGDCWIVTWEL